MVVRIVKMLELLGIVQKLSGIVQKTGSIINGQ